MVPNVTVWLPTAVSDLREAVAQLAHQIEFGPRVQVADGSVDPQEFDAILSVGPTVRPDLPWTAVLCDGWIARVSSGRSGLDPACSQTNAIAALATASMGATEVFKRLLKVSAFRGPLLDGETFSLLTFETGACDRGPPLPGRLIVDILLGGVGAIGNGVVLLLSQLSLGGRVLLADPQSFAEENLGTCVLIGPAEVGRTKAEVAASILRPHLDALAFVEPVSRVIERLGPQLQRPQVAIGALDSDEARRDLQGAWPDVVIDGAISPLVVQVGRHPWGPPVACLRCVNPDTRTGMAAEEVQSRALGLPRERLDDLERQLSDEDVAAASVSQRPWLLERRGKPICSILPEAVARLLSQENCPGQFAPSAPFVACMSAALVVAELVKFLLGIPSPLEPQFQFDVLQGPARGQMFPRSRNPECSCVRRRGVVERLRGDVDCP
jgi:hypothetical protein